MDTNKIKLSTNKNFGLVFFLIFLIFSLFPIFQSGNIRIWTIIPAITFLILGLLNSPILTPLNKIWFKFGILIGNFISPIVMGLVFFIIITPIALIMRILRKNLLSLTKSKNKSYWVEKSSIKSKMKNQF
mgnify:CR=1 FL=1|tara:strand:- start:225 stop:614 length:390 start_codon:yes stop_codon:yes gene_type:complete